MAPPEKLFPTDVLSKRQRVEATLALQSVDRVAILEQLSYNPDVISMYTGKKIEGFNYSVDDICGVIRQTTDLAMPPNPPRGTDRVLTEAAFVVVAASLQDPQFEAAPISAEDAFEVQNDNWTSWRVGRPFHDEAGARDWLLRQTQKLRDMLFDAERTRREYHAYMTGLQEKIGETVILNFSCTGMCEVYDAMGLEIFTFFFAEYPEVMDEFMKVSVENELRRIHAVADRKLSPVILIPEDFSGKQGPIFAPDFLDRFHRAPIRKLTDAWHEHDIKVLFHSDGNYKVAIPDLLDCGVDGFYCLEAGCGMDIVELKNQYPKVVWAGGIDGVDLMERGTPQQVAETVRRHITQTDALRTGGMFVATSSEINPPVRAENFRAMIEAVGQDIDADFAV